MYSEDVYGKLRGWSEAGLLLTRNLLPLMSPVARHPGWKAEERETLGFLLSACARASESALLLVAYGQLWDAEVLVRSAFEGSLKSAYLLQSPATFEERHQQYRHDLFQIALLKGHTKVADLIGILPENDHKSWRPYRDRLLSEEERAEISSRYPKAMRRALETKWGFTGLIGELSRSEDPLFSGFTGLADGYAMASHILHADIVGTSVPLDRDRRDEARRDAILLAHGVRLISDVHTCLQLRLGVGYRYIGQDPAPLIDAHQRIAALTESFGKVYEDWMGVEYPDG